MKLASVQEQQGSPLVSTGFPNAFPQPMIMLESTASKAVAGQPMSLDWGVFEIWLEKRSRRSPHKLGLLQQQIKVAPGFASASCKF